MFTERPRARALRLLRDTVAGPLAAGQPLPPERELAELCQVSRTTLRWALNQLADEGVLRLAGARTRLVADPRARPTIASNAIYLFSSIELGGGGPHRAMADGHNGGWGESIHLGALQGLRSHGRPVLIPGSGIPDEATVAALLRERPLGVLMPEAMLSGVTDERLTRAAVRLTAAGIPTVVYGELSDRCDRVCSDHEAGAYALSQWLIQRGCRRQLCLWMGPCTQPWAQRRRAGHERALREAGCPILPIAWVRWHHDPAAPDELAITVAGHLAPYLLSAEPLDAIVAMTDGQLPEIYAALRRCGREPGRDITVVGYDGYWRGLSEPPAATVDKRNYEMGKAMATLLEARIAGDLPPEPQECQIAPLLVTL